MSIGQELEQWLGEDLATRLRQAIESMTGEPPEVDVRPAARAEAALFWLAFQLSAGAGATICAGAPEAAWSAIGRRVLSSAGVGQPEEADLRSTYQEILTQALSSHAQAIGARLKREVTCEPASMGTPCKGGLALELIIRAGDETLPPVQVVFSDPLLSVLNPEVPVASPSCALSDSGDRITQADLPSSVTNSRTLELLLEVELPVSVSFGRAQLPLKDVLKLTSGSIVELNRSVSEPVEIIVNNCVIARGEVVVLEGNYGVRIHHIISRQERLRTLN
ncbi:MAG: flagellar motor switch protein FliN [Bryobacterales bacterium]|nr:flagellar motor switch protein FliN [Bryobacterales bacterium]